MCLAPDVVLDVGREKSLGGSRVGYSRVSTVDQTLDQQNAALEAAGVTKVFSDTISGARDDRHGLTALLEYVRAGKALGNRIMAFAFQNADRFGLVHVIWQQTYYPIGGKPHLMPNLGSDDANHYTHVYIATQGGGYPNGSETYAD